MLRAYLPPLVIAILISGGLTFYVKVLAEKLKLFDLPSPRKIHTRPIPRLGGVAIVISFIILAIGYSFASGRLSFASDKIFGIDKYLLGPLVGLSVLLVVGILDDIRGIKASKKLFWHFVAATVVI